MIGFKGPNAPISLDSESRAGSIVMPPALLLCLAGILVPVSLAYGFAVGDEMQVIALIFGAFGLLAIAARPFWGLIFFVALLYSRPEENIRALAGMHFTLMVSLVTMAGMCIQLCLDRKEVVRTPLNGMIVGFLAAVMLSASMVGNLSGAVMDIGRLVVLVFLILNLVRTPARYRALVNAIVVFTSFLAAYSTYLFFIGIACIDQGTNRSQGTGIFSDPNDLAATMTAGLALAITRVTQERKWTRGFYSLLACVMLLAILLTNSRGGLLAVITMAAGFLLVCSRRKGLAILMAGLLAGLLLVAAPGRMKNFDSQEESANSRFHFWAEGLTQLSLHPVTGVGYQKFPDVNGGYVAHNSFVHCFAELGLLGYFFWIGCIYHAFRRRSIPASDEKRAERTPLSPASRDLLGARLALLGYLTACFWISRTYTPVMYLLFSLPFAQQIASSGQSTLALYPPRECLQTWGKILGLCLLSIVFIALLCWKYR